VPCGETVFREDVDPASETVVVIFGAGHPGTTDVTVIIDNRWAGTKVERQR